MFQKREAAFYEKDAHQSKYFESHDSMKIAMRTWQEVGSVHAVAYVIHGYSGSYSGIGEFCENLSRRGFRVHACDLRGHGRTLLLNKGKDHKYNIHSLAHLEKDIKCFLEHVDADTEHPRFLIGYSMGGAAALELAVQESTFIRERLQGIILVSPAIDCCIKLSQSQTLILKALAKWLPNYNTNLIMPHGPDWCESKHVAQDPYYEDGMNLNTRIEISEIIVINLLVREGFDAIDRFREMTNPEISVPILIVHGEHDTVCCYKASLALYERLTAPSKEFYTLEATDHYIIRIPEFIEKNIEVISSWIEGCLSSVEKM